MVYRAFIGSIVFIVMMGGSMRAASSDNPRNLLLNPGLAFHNFEDHRLGKAGSFQSGNVAFWNADAWGDIAVNRASHVPEKVLPSFSVENAVSIQPGKRFYQFAALPELGLAHGDKISLSVFGYQETPGALKAKIKVMKLDSEDGQWCPAADFNLADKRTFPRHSRGELVVAKSYEATASDTGRVELKIENVEIPGRISQENVSKSADINAIGIEVEFINEGKDKAAAWVLAPSLVAGGAAVSNLFPGRDMVPYYRHVPRTIQKLWKGEAVHIIVMGSSIDRGSANPPMYPYNEDPTSPDFKKPLSDYSNFDTKLVGHPELNDYYGESRHYFSYAGRLRLELARKFNLPIDKLCLNFMACDGSCVGEAHSGLAEYCALTLPPNPGVNGHKQGKTWKELYPDLFSRPEGPRPDLVIFGSGANEKTDTPDEVAVFEGAIRWIQRHYPNTEFVFCQFQNYGGYTPNPGDLQALGLRYQIPFLDYGLVGDRLTRWCNRYAFVPSDGHPQAASHYVWFKALEKAFESWDPILPGQAQLQLPERVHVNAYGWEGDMVSFSKPSPRLAGNMFVFEDTAVNGWASGPQGAKAEVAVDGEKRKDRNTCSARRDVRNSSFRFGRGRLGDRHVVEVGGEGVELFAIDAKVCPDRRFFGVDDPFFGLPKDAIVDYRSEVGAPYGDKYYRLEPGKKINLEAVCTDLSAAYVDTPDGGDLLVSVDDVPMLTQPTNVPFVRFNGEKRFMENRKGVLGLAYGLRRITLEAAKAPVLVLGVFTYDSRSNRQFERQLNGLAAPGETVRFSLPFKARPLVICSGGLKAQTADVTPEQVHFSGDARGTYQIVGE